MIDRSHAYIVYTCRQLIDLSLIAGPPRRRICCRSTGEHLFIKMMSCFVFNTMVFVFKTMIFVFIRMSFAFNMTIVLYLK